MNETPAYPHIPYGQGDFRRIRLNRWLYVDKTRFLRRLEQEHYVFLIRPRRFGKTLWVSLLENYYDRWWGHEFEATFAGTDIGAGTEIATRSSRDSSRTDRSCSARPRLKKPTTWPRAGCSCGARSSNTGWRALSVTPNNLRGVFVVVTVFAFDFLGDGLRDAADPYK